ncbi:MAG TPA: hypothetical protein VE569_00370, partial [Acidimicrobiia bacterium]|nr:hypothetical protein [Acidimicrobiia bacterium]
MTSFDVVIVEVFMTSAAHHIEHEPVAPRPCSDCGGMLIPTRVVPDLYVSRRGNTHHEAWSTA